MKKIRFLIGVFVMLFGLNMAQVDSVYYGAPVSKERSRPKEKPPYSIKDKLSFGGNFMVWFGTSSYIYLSPMVNFSASKRLNLGLGLVYNYNSYSTGYTKYTYTIYGVQTYARFFATSTMFVQAEFDHLLQPNVYSYNYNDKVWVSYLFLGGGFRKMIGERAALFTSIMYNVINSPQAVFYPNPMIQIGILAGF